MTGEGVSEESERSGRRFAPGPRLSQVGLSRESKWTWKRIATAATSCTAQRTLGLDSGWSNAPSGVEHLSGVAMGLKINSPGVDEGVSGRAVKSRPGDPAASGGAGPGGTAAALGT